MEYQITDNTGNSITIVPGQFMLQKYLSFGNFNDIEVMESSASIAKACDKVCNALGYRIIQLSDGANINVRTLINISYQTTDNLNNSVEIVPGQFMLQKYLSFGNFNDIEVMESSASIIKAYETVCNSLGYRIIRLSDRAEINVRTAR